jgi:hypothetical protein
LWPQPELQQPLLQHEPQFDWQPQAGSQHAGAQQAGSQQLLQLLQQLFWQQCLCSNKPCKWAKMSGVLQQYWGQGFGQHDPQAGAHPQAGSQAGAQQAGSQAGAQQAGSQAGAQQAGSQAGAQQLD